LSAGEKNFMHGHCKNAIAVLFAWARTGLATEARPQFSTFGLSIQVSKPRQTVRAPMHRRSLRGKLGAAGRNKSQIRNMKIVVRDADTGYLRGKSGKLRSQTFDRLLRDESLARGRGVF